MATRMWWKNPPQLIPLLTKLFFHSLTKKSGCTGI